jgi:hypothetical protein
MRAIANSGKSPLSPLFQRGELAVEREELPSTYRAKLYLASWMIPPLKKGDKKGDLNFFTASGGKRGIRVAPFAPLRETLFFPISYSSRNFKYVWLGFRFNV